MSDGDPRGISVVVPAYNEAAHLPTLVASLRAAEERSPVPVEVIVADNDSGDATAAVARELGCRVAHVEQRAIAAARNGGAAIARHGRLAFVDADMVVHPDTFAVVDRLLRRDDVIGGVTRVTYERWSIGIALTYAAVFPVVRAMGVDTGVVFCRRVDFEEVGGFDTSRRIAEDVDLQRRLIRLGKGRGQRWVHAPEVRAVSSTRKFDEHGDFHGLGLGLRLAAGLVFRRSVADRVIDRYWYDARQRPD